MSDVIKVNTAYRMTPSVQGQPRKLAYVTGRQGNLISLMIINGIVTGAVVPADVCGREYAQIQTPLGMYNLSPVGEITDINEVADVCQVIMNCPE